MGTPAIRTPGRPVWARVVLTHLALLDGASVVGREVVPRAKGAPGACGQAVESGVLPPAASAAESVWAPRLLEGVDLVPASEQSNPPLQGRRKVASPSTAATTEEVPSFFSWKRARTLAPPSHLISAGICTPPFSASSSSRTFTRPPSLTFPMYRVSEILWIRIHFHLCWGTRSVMQLFTRRAALSTVSR